VGDQVVLNGRRTSLDWICCDFGIQGDRSHGGSDLRGTVAGRRPRSSQRTARRSWPSPLVKRWRHKLKTTRLAAHRANRRRGGGMAESRRRPASTKVTARLARRFKPDDVARIVYTSAHDRRSEGAELAHRNFRRRLPAPEGVPRSSPPTRRCRGSRTRTSSERINGHVRRDDVRRSAVISRGIEHPRRGPRPRGATDNPVSVPRIYEKDARRGHAARRRDRDGCAVRCSVALGVGIRYFAREEQGSTALRPAPRRGKTRSRGARRRLTAAAPVVHQCGRRWPRRSKNSTGPWACDPRTDGHDRTSSRACCSRTLSNHRSSRWQAVPGRRAEDRVGRRDPGQAAPATGSARQQPRRDCRDAQGRLDLHRRHWELERTASSKSPTARRDLIKDRGRKYVAPAAPSSSRSSATSSSSRPW